MYRNEDGKEEKKGKECKRTVIMEGININIDGSEVGI
jgi:hypothetical protein